MSYTFEEKKEYLNQFCKQFQSCSYGKDTFWYIFCTLDVEKPDVLKAIEESAIIDLDEDCGQVLIIAFN